MRDRLTRMLDTWINGLLGHFRLRLVRVRPSQTAPLDIESAFARLGQRNIPISSVIDIGASNGCWSERLMKHFPGCRYHLIEANPVHRPSLEQFAKAHTNASFCMAAAADSVGEIFFDGHDPWGGLASHNTVDGNAGTVPCTTVDAEISRLGLKGPFLLKLDTHGFEVPILKGAENALEETNVIVMEAYNFHLTAGCLTFWEMCDYLWNRGFRPADLLDPMHRPRDGMFWQVDFVFVRRNRPEFDDNTYA